MTQKFSLDFELFRGDKRIISLARFTYNSYDNLSEVDLLEILHCFLSEKQYQFTRIKLLNFS